MRSEVPAGLADLSVQPGAGGVGSGTPGTFDHDIVVAFCRYKSINVWASLTLGGTVSNSVIMITSIILGHFGHREPGRQQPLGTVALARGKCKAGDGRGFRGWNLL